jgi:hypothetical protein
MHIKNLYHILKHTLIIQRNVTFIRFFIFSSPVILDFPSFLINWYNSYTGKESGKLQENFIKLQKSHSS